MSRLYLLLEKTLAEQALTPSMLCSLLHALLESHAGLSTRVRLRIDYAHLLKRPSLASANTGWKAYPVTVEATLQDDAFRAAARLRGAVFLHLSCVIGVVAASQPAALRRGFRGRCADAPCGARMDRLGTRGRGHAARATQHCAR